MNERLLARVLFVLGFGILGLTSLLGSGWSEAGVLERATFVVGVVAAVIAVGLDFKHRHQGKRPRPATGGGPV